MTEDGDRGSDLSWERILGSTVLVAAASFYVGHVDLSFWTRGSRFGASVLSIYSYDDVLVRGVEILLNVVAPKACVAVLATIALWSVLQPRWRRVVGYAAVVAYAVYAGTAPFYHSLPWSVANSVFVHMFLTLLLVLLFFSIAALVTASVFPNVDSRARHLVVAGGWLFMLWNTAFWASIHAGEHEGPEMTIQYKDGRQECVNAVRPNQDTLIVWSPSRNRFEFISVSDVSGVSLGCASK